jgi:hypothetical protein
VKLKRLTLNLVAGIARLNAGTDVRHKRRPLSPQEVSQPVDSARSSGCDVLGHDCPGRLELAGLKPRSFRRNAAAARLKVDAACSKHPREDTLPMHPELVVLVREWIAGMDADTPLGWIAKTWLMVKKDSERIWYSLRDAGRRCRLSRRRVVAQPRHRPAAQRRNAP